MIDWAIVWLLVLHVFLCIDDSSGGSELEEWGEEGSEEDPGYAEYYSFNDDEGRASQVRPPARVNKTKQFSFFVSTVSDLNPGPNWNPNKQITI